MNTWSNTILAAYENFGYSPRKFSWFENFFFKVPRLIWLAEDPTDRLNVIYYHLDKLFENGDIVWGHIIQTNQQLFHIGSGNCPGEVVYSFDREVTPDYLRLVAKRLFSLRTSCPEQSELRYIANYLEDEMTRVYGLAVPKELSPEHKCFISSTIFVRRHLVKRRLTSSHFSILALKESPHIVMPLPKRYWHNL